MPTIPAYTFNGFTRPELHLDLSGNIVLDPVAANFAATYGIKALYIGVPASTPYPPVPASLTTPTDANGTANSVAEGAANGTAVNLTALATNTSGQPVSYTLTENAGGRFAINSTTGVVTVANGSLIDYENNPSHTIIVQANDGSLTTSQSFTIAVGDVNDIAPVFSSGTSATTPENVTTTTAIYTAHATDADGTALNNTVHYSLAAGGDNDLFHIDANTGAVTFINSPDADNPQDAGHNNVYDITVTASDGLPAHNVTRNVAITVTDINEAPVITSNGGGNSATVNLNEGTAAVTTVTATDPDVPVQTLSFTVLTGAGSPDGASFGIDGFGQLTFNSAPDFETPGPHGNSYTVQVRVTDDGAPNAFDTQTITVNVADINDNLPVFTSPTTAITPENVATTTAVYTALAPDADGTAANNTVHYSLAGGVSDNDLFSIDADTGAVTFIASPDFETAQDFGANNVYDIVVTASDGLPAHDVTRSVAITVTDVNDNAPVITSATAMAVDENSAGGAHVGTVTATDADASSPNNALTYTATGGTGLGLFDVNLNTGAVTVHNGVVLDREAAAFYTLDIVVADGGTPGLSDTQTIAINLNDLNDNAPVFASPTGSASVNEATSTATVVFDTNATDADIALANHTITYSLGGADAGDFAINANTGEVTFALVPNFETPADTGGNNVYDFTVIASDGVPAHDATQAVTITLVDLPPVFATPPDSNAAGNQSFDGAPVGSSTGIDAAADDPAGGTVTYSLFDNAGGRFGINTTTGVVTVAGPIVFDTGTPANNTVTVTVRASDASGAHSDHDYTITILQEQPPEVTSFNTLVNYTENQGPAVIDGALTVTDPNNTTLTGAAVQITTNYVNGEDLLAFANTATITGIFNPVNGMLTLTGTDTVANYQAALRAVTYVNTSDNPSAAPRTVKFTANDGTVNSAAATDTFNVLPVNDAPVIGASHILPYTENQTPTAIDPALTLTDVDSANILTATVQITGNFVNGEDILDFAPIGNITGSFNALNGTMTLSGSDTVANYQLALRAVTYFNTSDNPSTLARTVTFIANDGATSSTPVTDSITVAPVEDAPAVVAGHALSYSESQPPTAIDTLVTVSDADSPLLASATVQITGNYVDGEDHLSFTNQNGISGSFNATTGTMTLSGLSSVANYQTALASVAYSNSSSHPSALDRTVTYIASDGTASSTAATSIIHVAAVNSPPDLTPNAPGAASYTENAAATALLSTGAITDPDTPANFIGGSFTAVITANAATGDQIVLLGSSPFALDGTSLLYAGDILGSIAGLGTSSVTVTGLTAEATPTVVNLLAKAFGFQNTTDDPATLARTVTFTFNDGGNTGGGALTDSVVQTVNVTAVNDAPVNSVPAALQVTDTATDIPISGLSVSDVDSGGLSETTTLHVVNGTLNVATVVGGAVVGGTGSNNVTLTGTIAEINITLAAAGSILYHPGAAGSDTLTVTTNDGGRSGVDPSTVGQPNTGTATTEQDVDTVPILVTAPPVANAPALDLDGPGGGTGFTASFTEGLAAVPIADSDASIIDADSPMMASATITLTNHQAGDVLSVNGTLPAGISAGLGYDPLTGILTLTGAASPAAYAVALHQIEFSNSSDNPSTVDRSIAVVVNDDGAHVSNTAIATIHVAGTNDAPLVDLDGSTLGNNYTTSYTATGPFVAIANSNDAVTDLDNATLVSATVRLTDAKPNDVLAISGLLPAGISAVITTGGGTITVALSGTASTASYQAALHQVVFANSGASPDLSPRHLDVTVSDGTDSSPTATTTINVAGNSAPVAHDDAASATEAGGVNNAVAGTNPSGNLVTGTGAAGAVADSDVQDPATVLTVVAVHTGAEGGGGNAGIVGTGLQGSYGTLTLNVDGSYSYAIDNSNATVQGLTSASPPLSDTFNYTIQDSGGLQDTATFTVTIHGANDLPLAVANTGTITENAAPTTFSVLGNDVLDPDTGALNTIATGSISATGPAGANIDPTDVGVAVIGGTQLQITLGADFQRLTGAETATITVPYTLTGNAGETSTANLVVTVNGVNDLPVAVSDLTGNTMTEDAAATTFSVLGNDTLDLDHGALNTITTGTVTASGPAGEGIDGADVTVSVIGGTQIRVTLGSDFQHLQEGQTATIDVPYTLHGDGADASTATLEVSVTGLNDAPVVASGAGATFTENGSAVSVAGSLTLTDVDNTTLSGATVSLTNAQANDVLSVQGQGASGDLASGVHFVVDNAAHTVTFSNVEAASDYQAALRLVQFSNSSENPSTTTRSFTITADDGQALNHSGSASASLTVVSVDDAPVNTVPADSAVPTAFSNTNTAISGISVADGDAGSGPITTQLSVTNGTVAVTLAGSASISAGANGSATLTLSGTPADINATLANNVTFHSTDGFTGQANLTVLTNDLGHTGTGGPLSDTDVVHIGVVPQVWFIDNSNSGPGNGTGTTADPFHSIAAFNASAGPGQNDYIVIRTGTGTYTGDGLNLQDGQQVYGAGETLSFTNPVNSNVVTILNGTGARPTINVTTAGDQGIDLAANNTIHGVNITTAAGTSGLDDGNNGVGTLTVDHMTISGAGRAVDIDQGGTLSVALESVSSTGGAQGIQLAGTASSGAGLLSGSFSATGGAISGSTTAGFLVGDGAGGANTGGTATISYAGTITASNGASVVNIQDHSTGAVTLSGNLTHTGASGSAIVLDDNSSNFTFSGATNNLTTGSSNAINITDQTGGTVGFSGALNIDTTTGAGVNLGGISTGTFNFTGGNLTVDTTTGNGFVATGGGSVNVTGTGNHIASTGGTALNISNTTIGASNVTFHDINANGGTNGIVLNNTGTSGHLAVTGNGSVAQGGDSSGGTIQNTTGAGISLTSTLSPTLNNMNIQSTGGSGISGTDVTNFSFTNGTINNSGTGHGVDTSNIAFNSSPAGATNNVDGTITITNNILSNAFYHGVDIQNRAGTIDNATISNNAITSATVQANAQGSGIHIVTFGTATSAANLTKATIDGNTIVNFPMGAGIAVLGGNSNAAGPGGTMGVPNNATNVIAITNNNIHGQSTASPIGSEGIVAVVQGGNAGSRSQGNFNISGNSIANTLGQGIAMSDFGNATVNAKVNNNTVDTNNIGKNIGSNGIGIGTGVVGTSTSATPLMTVEVIGNTVTDYDGNGIRLVALDTNGTLNATVQNNSVGRAAGGGFPSRIRVDSGNENNAGNNTINLDITGNMGIGTSVAADAPGIGIRLGDGGAATNILRIEGLTPSPATDLQAESYIAGKNPGMFAGTLGGAYTPAKRAEVIHGNTFFGTAGNVPQPLLAVASGVQASSPTAGETHLTQVQLDSVVAAAIAQWAHAGASASQLAALAAITFSVADLAGNTVGVQTAGHIVVDADAAGHGWFVDPTPSDNSEFTHAANAAGTKLLTDPTNAAAGHLDLLTTVTHEMGHELGLPDLTAASDVNELMYIDLADGERRLPDAGDVPVTTTPLTPNVASGPVVPTATPGNDTIDAGHGGKILVGGAGADNFVFAHLPDAATPPTHVADYSFLQGDSLDFSALTSAFHGSGASDAQIVRAVEDASGTFATLQVNVDGPYSKVESWINVAQLDGAHAGDDVRVLIDSHAVHLAQVHVGLLV